MKQFILFAFCMMAAGLLDRACAAGQYTNFDVAI